MKRKFELPALQVALDQTSWGDAEKLLARISRFSGPRLVLEAGTPLIKAEGVRVVSKIKSFAPSSPVVADMKTLDTAEIEVGLAASAGADAVVASGAAPKETLQLFIGACRKNNVLSFIDSLGVDDLLLLAEKARGADLVVLHRGIDEEALGKAHSFSARIPDLKKAGFKIAVAGGLNLELSRRALELGADIVIVGRDITGNPEPDKRVKEYLELLASF